MSKTVQLFWKCFLNFHSGQLRQALDASCPHFLLAAEVQVEATLPQRSHRRIHCRGHARTPR